VVRLQAVVIIDDIIVGGTNSSPTGGLADQVKVVPEEEHSISKAKPKHHIPKATKADFPIALATQSVWLLSPRWCQVGGSAACGPFL
jgi:hypothetical protein